LLGYSPSSTVQPGLMSQCTTCRSIRMTLDQMPDPTRLRPPLISYQDFLRALQHSKPTSSEADLARYEQYTRETGSEGK
jgi:Vps4 C terminal oligomerisation domain